MNENTKWMLGAVGVVAVLYYYHQKSASKKMSAEAKSIIEQDCMNSVQEEIQNGMQIPQEGVEAYVRDCTEALIKQEEEA